MFRSLRLQDCLRKVAMERTTSESDLRAARSLDQENCKTPVKPRYGDRFVPVRAGNNWNTFPETPNRDQLGDDYQDYGALKTEVRQEQTPKGKNTAYSCLLKNEVLGYDYEVPPEVQTTPKNKASRRLFNFDSGDRPKSTSSNGDRFSPYSKTPISRSSQSLISTPVKRRSKISKHPYKILDAPSLADDYYLNLIDWSSKDVISVGLGPTMYSWTASTGVVETIANLEEHQDQPTSVKWNDKGTLLAFGSELGLVRVWDVVAEKIVFEKVVHNKGSPSSRIAALEWYGDMLITGSKDRLIKLVDLRSEPPFDKVIGCHGQEVCGLKWSSFNSCLASGGNDNTVALWSLNADKPLHVFREHTAAIKAIAWSPHDRHVLATGGGSSDKCLKFWNTISGTCISSVNTNSQVCNVAWSPHSKELVTTHGYVNNFISVWKYPSLKNVASLKGHSQRVLYMAMSPDGNNICTGAADESLRFWKIFDKVDSRVRKSTLDLFDGIR